MWQPLIYKLPDMGWLEHTQHLLSLRLLASSSVTAAVQEGGLGLCDAAHRNKQTQRSQLTSLLSSYHFCKNHWLCRDYPDGIGQLDFKNTLSTFQEHLGLSQEHVAWNHLYYGTTSGRQVHTALLKQNSHLIQLLAMKTLVCHHQQTLILSFLLIGKLTIWRSRLCLKDNIGSSSLPWQQLQGISLLATRG